MTDFNSSDRDVNRAIRSWLREDRHEDVSRVAGAVLDQVDAIPQRRSTWWPARRTPTMNKIVGFGLAAAAVVAIALIGSQLIGSPDPGGTGSGTTSSPEPSVAEPTASPSIDAGLPVGSSYALADDDVTVTATIPAPGWAQDPSGLILVKNGNGAAPDGAYNIGVWVTPDPLIPSDPCEWESTMPDTPAANLDEIVAALGNQATRNASAAEDVTVDGYAGKVITIEMPDGPYQASGNPDCDEDKLCTLGYGDDPTACQMWFQEAGQIDELWIVDVDGEFFFVPGSYFSETPASVVDELRALLGSMTFGE
jgi:hypothetical protein